MITTQLVWKFSAKRLVMASLLGSYSLLLVITACSKIDRGLDDYEQTLALLEKAKDSAVSQSDAWRGALTNLIPQLSTLEGQTTADLKTVIADARNSAEVLLKETVDYTSIKFQQSIAQAGVEARCSAQFVQNGVTSRLQYLIDDLKFWKKTRHHLDAKPAHVLCQIVGQALSLHPRSGGGFSIDSTGLIAPNVVGVFGYNFRRDALPRLELQDSSGKRVRDLEVLPEYVSQYQLTIDLSKEMTTGMLTGLVPGGRAQLAWSDGGDPNDITLTIVNPANLKIVDLTFNPRVPTAEKDVVTLRIVVENTGGDLHGTFTLNWTPPDGLRPVSLSIPDGLSAGARLDRTLPGGVMFRTPGPKQNTISISTGDTKTPTIQVAPLPARPPVFVHKYLLLFWDHLTPSVLYVVDRAKSDLHSRESNMDKTTYVRKCCEDRNGGVFHREEYDHLQNMPSLPNITRAERNQKACIRDQHIFINPALQSKGLPSVQPHWPEILDDDLWFIVEGDHRE